MKKYTLIASLGLMALLTVLVVLTGCTWSTAEQFNELEKTQNEAKNLNVSMAFDQGQYDRGQSLYLKQYCGSCHTLDSVKTRGTFGPAHNGLGTTAAARINEDRYNGEASDAYGYIYESLVQPGAYIVSGFENTNHHMPAYTHLAEQDLKDLTYFLANQQ